MSYFDPNKFYHAYSRIDEQDRRWLAALPDEPFRLEDAQAAWGFAWCKNAQARLRLLKASGLVRFVRHGQIKKGVESGRWEKCKEDGNDG